MYQIILGNQCKFCFPTSVKGSKLIVKIKKGWVLVKLRALWDMLQKKVKVEFKFITRQVYSQIFHKPWSQPLYKKVHRENENRLACIQFPLFHLYILRVHIVKSHKSLFWILVSKPGFYQDKHSFPSFSVESKRVTSLMVEYFFFNWCHNYMYSYRWIKQRFKYSWVGWTPFYNVEHHLYNKRLLFELVKSNLTHNNGPFLEYE